MAHLLTADAFVGRPPQRRRGEVHSDRDVPENMVFTRSAGLAGQFGAA
jgi:hypothetical protein